MNLVVCCTMYQLLNAVNLVEHQLDRMQTDLLLSYATDFDSVKEGLQKAGIFRKIYTMPGYIPREREFRQKPLQERRKIEKNPCLFLDYSILDCVYDDIYLATDDVFGKLLYYYLSTNSNHQIRIHLFEDGLLFYVKDYKQRALMDGIRGKRYGKKAFEANIVEYWIYEPNLYCGSAWEFPISQLPKIGVQKTEVSDLLKQIFLGNQREEFAIEQPFLYLVEAFIDKKIVVEDIRLLDFIASKVGKEEIAVKLHPRENIDRFTPRGYQVLENFTLPWEILLLANKERKKALFSFSSTACLTAKMVFDMDFYGVFCCQMPLMNASYMLRNQATARFIDLAKQVLNEKDRFFFTPSRFEELEEVLIYLEGKLHG